MDELARKAGALGLPPMQMTVVKEYGVTDNETGAVDLYYEVEIAGEPPKLQGWTFLAVLDHASATANIIRKTPAAYDHEIDPKWRTAPPHCDHCGTTRTRKDTFLLRHDDGTTAQVGRNCLIHYIGHSDPNALAAYLEFMADTIETAKEYAERERDDVGRTPHLWSLERYVANVFAVAEAKGFVSALRARNEEIPSTASSTIVNMLERDRSKRIPVTEAHIEQARAAIAHVREFSGSMNDFMYNLWTALQPDVVHDRNLALVAALYSLWKREQERVVELAVRPSQFRGTIGVRELFRNLKVVSIHDLPGDFSTTHLHIFQSEEGDIFKWFSSNKRLNQGETYNVKGTVKNHQENRGRNETIINRCECTLV